jgi:hypothetical protein
VIDFGIGLEEKRVEFGLLFMLEHGCKPWCTAHEEQKQKNASDPTIVHRYQLTVIASGKITPSIESSAIF